MAYFPDKSFSKDIETICKRASMLKPYMSKKGVDRNWVIFENGTVITVSKDQGQEEAKEVLNECMCSHPDFRIIIEKFEDQICYILLMNEYGQKGAVSTYLFSNELEKIKYELNSDEMLCEGEVLFMNGNNPEEIKIGLYGRLRVFADGKEMKIHCMI